jgi:hypothetical protein
MVLTKGTISNLVSLVSVIFGMLSLVIGSFGVNIEKTKILSTIKIKNKMGVFRISQPYLIT